MIHGIAGFSWITCMVGLKLQQSRESQYHHLCSTLTMNSVTELMTSHNIANPNAILRCSTLTMNSVTALMTSHNIANPNSILESGILPLKTPTPHSDQVEFTHARYTHFDFKSLDKTLA
jgi:hypothetical protein